MDVPFCTERYAELPQCYHKKQCYKRGTTQILRSGFWREAQGLLLIMWWRIINVVPYNYYCNRNLEKWWKVHWGIRTEKLCYMKWTIEKRRVSRRLCHKIQIRAYLNFDVNVLNHNLLLGKSYVVHTKQTNDVQVLFIIFWMM